tara:strand:- start:2414 stop:2764 length:351 start_codon:yes stop_codon:yes gene_type:complete
MPRYDHICKCGKVFEHFCSLKDFTGSTLSTCCGLDSPVKIGLVGVGVFKPYNEENFTGKTIEITSSSQRDALCEQHGLSYDSTRYVGKPKETSAVDDVTMGDVKEAYEAGVGRDAE